MRQKRIAILALICILTGCEGTTTQPVQTITPYEYSDFKLMTDSKTNIVYIDNVIRIPRQNGGDVLAHVYTPYYSKNGKICKYLDDKMVEIEGEE